MNIPVPPISTIEWPRPEYEYNLTCSGYQAGISGQIDHMNSIANQGWELIHINDSANSIYFYWRRLKILGVPV